MLHVLDILSDTPERCFSIHTYRYQYPKKAISSVKKALTKISHMWDILSDIPEGLFFTLTDISITKKAIVSVKKALTKMTHMWDILSDTPDGSFLHTHGYQYYQEGHSVSRRH